MKKTLILLSFLVLAAFLGGILYSYAEQSTPRPVIKGSDRAHVFSDLRRATVKDSQGQFVGRITDLVINPDGRISFAIVSPFWTDGLSERLLALPFDALSFQGKSIALETTADKLMKAPIFNKSYLNARNWGEDANRYFGIQSSWQEACEEPAARTRHIPMTKDWNRPYAASEIVGTQVKNAQGEAVGKIDDLVFDEEGRISLAILGYGGFLGIGEKLVAVPVAALSYAEEPRHFAMNTTKQDIQSAPLFSKKAMDDPDWASESYRYFGQQPHWTKEK